MSIYEVIKKENIRLKFTMMPYLEAYILSDGLDPDDVISLKFIADDICQDEVMVVITYRDHYCQSFSVLKKQLFTEDVLEETVKYSQAMLPEKKEFLL